MNLLFFILFFSLYQYYYIIMGKWTDKLYITHSEWSNDYGGMSFGGAKRQQAKDGFRRLPFDCCSLSLRPFEHPVCTPKGIIYDLENIAKYLKKEKTDPVTGEPLKMEDLKKLTFYKNANDEYHCPITMRVFNENTHIVAISTSGNVYAYDAVERLNIKAKHWQDLMTDEPFTRKDIITLQDPQHLEKQNLSTFKHLKSNKKAIKVNYYVVITIHGDNEATPDIKVLAEIKSTKGSRRGASSTSSTGNTVDSVEKAYFASNYSTGRAAASLTSTAMVPETTSDRIQLDRNQRMYDSIKTKGYAQIKTNLGEINVELHCDQISETCHNFILLAKSGYYKNTVFHRLIKNFMIQGGDPTGSGKGGESAWKRNFADEFKPNLTHNQRGILSMANHGKDTNSSQFFITFRPCQHLDNKHTIFGHVVGGMAVLDKMEAISTDDKDRPVQDIRIQDVQVFVDPFDEYEQRLSRKLDKLREAKQQTKRVRTEEKETWLVPSSNDGNNKGKSTGVGKYMKSTTSGSSSTSRSTNSNDVAQAPAKKSRVIKRQWMISPRGNQRYQ
ncbi:cyclophilin-like domain-containing protein [Syncephalis plumigaleata]|nr:cyclophilin-like domain-containing protein [Syncephalis plumigaleata]